MAGSGKIFVPMDRDLVHVYYGYTKCRGKIRPAIRLSINGKMQVLHPSIARENMPDWAKEK